MAIMQLSRIVIVLNLLVSTISINAFLDYEIIEGYFREKKLNRASIVGCFSKEEQLKISKNFSFKPVKVLNIHKIDPDNCLQSIFHLGVILDGDCENAQHFLRQSGKRRHFDEKHHWLILTSKRNFKHFFEDVDMFINADIQVIYHEENPEFIKNYTIVDVYNPSSQHGGSLKIQSVGFYNAEQGYNIRERGCKYWNRRNMTETTLKTTVVLFVPFEGKLLDYLSKGDNKDINTFDRFHFTVMSSCQRYYNFTAEVSLSRSWGYLQKDGTFDGMAGALQRKEIDYGGSGLFVKPDRMGAIQLGRKTWNFRAAFIFLNPKSVNAVDGFVQPLSPWMWALTVVSAIFLMSFLRVSCLCEKKNIEQQVDVSWSYFMLCAIGALCQQGMTTTPYFPSGRIATLFLFLLALLIYQFYSASLVSHLLMESPTRITSVDDITRSNLRVGCEDTPYNRDYFKYTTDKSSRKLYHEKILNDNPNRSNFLTSKNGIELVRRGRYAFHVELSTAYPIIRGTYEDKAMCDLREVQLYSDQPMHANYQKDSPFKEMFDTCLQRIVEVGIMTREILFWHPMKPACIQSSKSVTFNIGLDEFYPTLMILGMGIIISLIVLVIEMYAICEEKTSLIRPFVK